MSRLWCANVVIDYLKGQDDPIPDTVFCWADDYEEAVQTIANANWSQYLWVPGKSVCRIRMLFEIFSEDFEDLDAEEQMDQKLSMLSLDVIRQFPDEQMEGHVPVEVRPRTRSRSKSASQPQKATGDESPTTQSSRTRRRVKAASSRLAGSAPEKPTSTRRRRRGRAG